MLNWQKVLQIAKDGNPAPAQKISKTEAEWREQLSPDQFRVTRQQGTERRFSNEMCALLQLGIYACVCCKTRLFDATSKFDSGTGWPSFTEPLDEKAIAYHADTSLGMTRVETTCNTCDAHLGHVFTDGPTPTGLRYCMNAVALEKVNDAD